MPGADMEIFCPCTESGKSKRSPQPAKDPTSGSALSKNPTSIDPASIPENVNASLAACTKALCAAGRLSQQRRGALIVVDLGSDLRPEDFLNPGVAIGAQLSRELLLNVFAADTPLHDGAVLVRGNRIESAGVILPLSRHSVSRYGTRHLAALGITERFDRCICIVVSEETGTLSLANQGKLERPITSSRLETLLRELFSNTESRQPARRTVGTSSSDSLT